MSRGVENPAGCGICGGDSVVELPEYRRLRRVTSDCRSWPSGGRLGVCPACGAVQKPVDDAFRAEIIDIYSAYAIYHQAEGEEQAVFEKASGQPVSRSAKILANLQMHVGLQTVGRMLDVGCGNGATIRAFGKIAPKWTKVGTEFDAKYRAEVESIPATEPLHVGSVSAVPGKFDVITLIHVLEHLVSPIDTLIELRDKLLPRGLLLIQVPHHLANPFELLIADHRSHFSTNSLARVLEAAGYEIVLLAEDWIPKELSVVARPGAALSSFALGIDAAVVRSRLAKSVQWLTDTASRLRSLVKEGSVGLFGTSIAGTWLATESDDKVAFFVDEDPARVGRTYRKRSVYAPFDVPFGSRVFVGLPSRVAADICRRLARPGVVYLPPEDWGPS